MNDFWNDPPESPDLPFCEECDEYMTIAPDAKSAMCPTCQKAHKLPDNDMPEPADIELPDDYLKDEKVVD